MGMQKLHVLVVDDDALNLRIAARLLRGLGHGGALASDGEKALHLIGRQAFDLMLLDVNMPGLGGEGTLRALREREQGGARRLPVLMVSGYSDDGTRQHFLDAGADGFVPKPLAADTLARELARLGLH